MNVPRNVSSRTSSEVSSPVLDSIAVHIQTMPTAAEYMKHAEECLAAADNAHDENERDMLLSLAERWRKLAGYKANIEARAKPEEP